MKFAFHFLKIFVLLGGAQFSIQQATTTANPECRGMDRAVQHAQTALRQIKPVKNPRCTRNNNCSGFSCTATLQNKPLKVTIEILQCQKPIKAHVDFTYDGTSYHHNVQDGKTYTIYESRFKLLTLKLKIGLKRNGNIVMAVANLEVCIARTCTPHEILNQNFTVMMKNCPGYSTASPVPYTETRTTERMHRSTTTSKTAHSMTQPPTTRKMVMTSSSQKPRSYYTQGHTTETMNTISLPASTEKPRHSTKDTSSTTNVISVICTTEKPSTTPREPKPNHAKQRGEKKSGLTSGQVAGIAVGCILVVLIVVGALFYYKRCYRRSRLRSAYYNDISMNDPLYDDFGPEIA